MLKKSVIMIFAWGIIALFLGGCSSSSYYSRYNKTEKKEKKENNKVRFTSDDSVNEKNDNDDVVSFSNLGTDENEFDVEPVEEFPVDTKEFLRKHEKVKELSTALTPRERVLFEIISYLDTPYKYGGETRKGIDCSAFTQKVFSKSSNIELPRTARQQFKEGEDISKNELSFGDLVFFNTRKGVYPGHVGIYIGEDLFAHASRSKGVTISSLENSYYKARYVGGRRIHK